MSLGETIFKKTLWLKSLLSWWKNKKKVLLNVANFRLLMQKMSNARMDPFGAWQPAASAAGQRALHSAATTDGSSNYCVIPVHFAAISHPSILLSSLFHHSNTGPAAHIEQPLKFTKKHSPGTDCAVKAANKNTGVVFTPKNLDSRIFFLNGWNTADNILNVINRFVLFFSSLGNLRIELLKQFWFCSSADPFTWSHSHYRLFVVY